MYRGAALLALLTGTAAMGQSLPADPAEADNNDGLIVVQGYKQSLESAAAAKRADNGIVEVIDAQGIANFPDLNLAEALQRVPGVAIDRDGGEGRPITVRGLSAEFTRVRLNGIEALATAGGKDQASGQGGANRSRGFDFQVFASELFSRVTVRKSQAAEIEEGSLGATVDLATALPFDYPALAGAVSAEMGYNDLSRTKDPRFSALISNQWADGKIGALLSVAYSSRRVREEGASSGRWENPSVPNNSSGCFQSPGPCNNPAGTYSAVNSAWHARIPRYGRLDYDWNRLGVTAAIQLRPAERTLVTLNGLYAHMGGTRREYYLEIISLSRSGRQATAQTDVRDFTISDKNELIKATFDDVDARVEERYDKLSTDFRQASIEVEQEIGDRLHVSLQAGQARSVNDNPIQTTVTLDRYDTDGYSYDFSQSQKQPNFTYGFDVTDPANWQFSTSTAAGDPSLIRVRTNRTSNRIRTGRLDARFEIGDDVALKAGGLYKQYRFVTREQRRYVLNGVTEGAVPLPAGVTLADITHLVSGFGRNLGMPDGTPRSWLSIDIDKLQDLLDFRCNCVNQYGDFRLDAGNQLGSNRDVAERDVSVYAQLDFKTWIAGMPLRGNIGARYAWTRSAAGGYAGTIFVQQSNNYGDFLPALNMVLEPHDDVVVRFSAAKVMARPSLAALTPGGTISNTGRSLTIGNPRLDPIRATAFDLNLEWYPDRETQLSLGVFVKNLSSYIQSSTITIPFGQTGLSTDLLSNGNAADTIFAVSRFDNTSGGKLRGFEVAAQRPFTFLPAPFDGFGAIANFTYVKSTVTYILDSSTSPPKTLVLPLAGLSKRSWNATLYYERQRFGARLSGAYRSGYVSGVPGGNGSDARGKLHSFTLDANATFQITQRATVTFQALNLTDVFDNRWIDTGRRNIEESTHTGRQFFLGLKYTL
jgi:iron complex outermembrane receptor protein